HMQTTIARQTPDLEPDLPTLAGRLPNSNLAGARSKSPAFKARANGNGHGHSNRGLVEALAGSKVFQDYERAFTEATGLPVALRPVETWQLPHHGKRNEGPWCSLMSEKSRACASCLQVQEKLSEAATLEAHTMTCPAGLCDSAVP